MRQVVVLRAMEESPDEAVELVRDNVVEHVSHAKSPATAPIWLCGGAQEASILLNAGLVDRVEVKLNPVVYGSGIPLFGADTRRTSLKLTRTKVYGCGIVVVEYVVVTVRGCGIA